MIGDAGFTTRDDLVHGFVGGYLPPVLGDRTRTLEEVPDFTLEEGMTIVIQPNVVTPRRERRCADGRAGRGDGRRRRAAARLRARPAEDRLKCRIDWDVPIEMDDGVCCAPTSSARTTTAAYPVILSYGPYAKGLAFQEGYPNQWEIMVSQHPDVEAGSSNRYQNWEVVDPEKWVPDGYVCVRVDSRGAGRSPGRLDPFAPRETSDLAACIEWAASQPWSSGKVGLNGISYYAMNQWHVASLRPRGLAAMCAWEGASDWYRDASRHGGILCTFFGNWYEMQVTTVQYGLGSRGPVNPNTGEPVAGPETLARGAGREPGRFRGRRGGAPARRRLPPGPLRRLGADRRAAPVRRQLGRARSAPARERGGLRALGVEHRSGSSCTGAEHWTHFYTDYGVRLQKRFFGHFLKGEDTGWDEQPPVLLQVRHADGTFTERAESRVAARANGVDAPLPRCHRPVPLA